MKLELYLSRHKLTQQEFARRIGYTQSRISRVLSGSIGVSDRLLKRIYEVTDGAVTPNDLLLPSDAAPKEAAE